MNKVQLTPNGLTVSQIVAGVWRMAMWNQTLEERTRWIHECFEVGIHTFDHADIYGSYTCESMFGEAFKRTVHTRDEIVLISKCGIQLPNYQVNASAASYPIKIYNTSTNHIIASAENSLKRLGTDYLDLLLIHRPDPLMNADEVASAFQRLKQSGKVRWFGVSNHSASQAALLQSRLDFPLVTNQVEISVLHRNALYDGVLDYCQQQRARPMAWSPLAGGELAKNESALAALQRVGKEIDASVEQVALAWLLSHPSGIVPVIGTGNIDRIKQLAFANKMRLNHAQWFSILNAAQGHEIP
jgi:predicted oxidoreductase